MASGLEVSARARLRRDGAWLRLQRRVCRSCFQQGVDLWHECGWQFQEILWARRQTVVLQLQLWSFLANDEQWRPVRAAEKPGPGSVNLAEPGLGHLFLCLSAAAEAIDAARD